MNLTTANKYRKSLLFLGPKKIVVTESIQSLLLRAYAAFNKRDIDEAVSLMSADVRWPNGWEGGYVNGREEVRDYWTRQWKESDPHVIPVSFFIREDNCVETEVRQVVKDMQGSILADTIVTHVYTIEDGQISSMEIVEGNKE